jgi:hypothetical protein
MEWLNKFFELVSAGAPLLVRLAWGPADPPFSPGTDFREFRPQFATIVVLALGLTSSTWIIPDRAGHDIDLRYLQYLVVSLIVVTLVYMAVSRIFRIQVSPEQTFYAFSLLVAPWIPILACCLRIGTRVGRESTVVAIIFLVIGPPIIILIAIFNVSRGIARIGGCSLWRAFGPMAVLALIVAVSIYVL